MDFFNIPEPPSFERTQNDYSQKQIDLLNEIKENQEEQMRITNQMQAYSNKEKKFNRIGFFIPPKVAIIAAIGAWIPIILK